MLLVLAAPGPLRAQDSIPAWWAWAEPGSLTEIGSAADDRLRTGQILGQAPLDGYLLRTPSSRTLAPGDSAGGLRVEWIAPRLALSANSQLPLSQNDGALWAGRGLNLGVMGGVRVSAPRVRLTLAPQLLRVQNRPVRHMLSSERPGSSLFQPPWPRGGASIDLPLRMGNESYLQFDLGQSMAEVDVGAVAAGASTENQWWGPGIRNGLLMSNHAAGIPHLYLRSARPLRAAVGTVEARWMVGWLTESLFFDPEPDNDLRSLSGLVATLRPALAPGLVLGAARVVYAPVDGAGEVPLHALDVLLERGQPTVLADTAAMEPGPDQLISLFARWVLPEAGAEVYAEWARHELPSGLRDLLVSPEHSQGYTLGLQWARAVGADHRFRLQAEATYLEMSSTYRRRPVKTFYTSRRVAQGYTHRGQVIGAAIGPGASSQWLALDVLGARWQAGLFGQRVRWDNDAYYTRPWGYAHDVSVITGLRAAGRLSWAVVSAELVREIRLNYLFQDRTIGFGGADAIDVRNLGLRFSVTPDLR